MIATEQNFYGINDELIQEITGRIVREFHPHKIILFGSHAAGRPRQDSDLDLFIIMDSDLRRDYRAAEIYKLFRHRCFAMDVIVYTPEEVKMSLERRNPFIRDLLGEGKVLYERKQKLS